MKNNIIKTFNMDDIEVLIDEEAPLILHNEDPLSLDFHNNHQSSYSTFKQGKIFYLILFSTYTFYYFYT